MVGDKCASVASELGDIVSGGTDGRDGESSSVRWVRGATTGRRGGSAGSSAAGADEEGVGSSPGTDQAMTWTSVGGDTMGDSDAETKELAVGLLV